MKKMFFFSFAVFFSMYSYAQTAEDSVKSVIRKLFAAMKSSDALALQDCFADSAILQTITASGQIRNEPVKEFIRKISTLPKEAADERIIFEVIKVDAALASVWTPYKFYFNGQFSHCGVNSFQLVRLKGAWKIQYLIDTRRKVGCQ